MHRTRAIEGLEGPVVFISKIEKHKKNKFLVVPPRELLLQEFLTKVNYFNLGCFIDLGNLYLGTVVSKLMKNSPKPEKKLY